MRQDVPQVHLRTGKTALADTDAKRAARLRGAAQESDATNWLRTRYGLCRDAVTGGAVPESPNPVGVKNPDLARGRG